MKKIINCVKAIAIAFIFCTALQNKVYAQGPPTIVLPSNSDVAWFTTPNQIQGINTAEIASSGLLFAGAYYDGTSNPSVYVNFGYSITSTGSMASIPDIIIGNSVHGGTICSSCTATTDYIVATAFVNTSGDVEIDFYRYHSDGVHPITFTSLPLATKTISGYGYVPQTVHLDVIAASGSNCNKYAVTWDDYSGGSGPVVYAAYGDINANTLNSPQLITPSGTYGYSPDVAAIQRGPASSPNDWALITYVDAGGNTLYYSEWNMTTSSTPTFTTIDNGASSFSVALPRIDAIDDLNNNSSASHANYEIVAQSTIGTSGETAIKAYNNVSLFFQPSEISLYGVAGYHHPPSSLVHFAPSVAVGTDGAGGYNYMVQHYTADSLIYPDSCFLFTEPLNYTTPTTFVGNNIYWISNNSYVALDGGDCNFANAVCTAPNDPTLNGIFAWAFYNGTNYEVDLKRSLTTGGSISFKTSQTSTSVDNVSGIDWHIYPNPVKENLVISTTTKDQDANYQITDILGHTVLQGGLLSINQNVDVSKIVPGSYIITVYKDNSMATHLVFTKD